MCTMPVHVPLNSAPINLNEIKKIHGGGGHLMILDLNGKLFASGWNSKGQLGLNSIEDKHIITAVKLDKEINFVDVSCGWDSTAAIDKNGDLYVWGSNAFDQLGFSASKTETFFKVPLKLSLPNNERVLQVVFGLRYMCILCDTSTIYITGRWKYTEKFKIMRHNDTNFYGLNIGEFNISQITSGSNHILCSDGLWCVIGFGDNKFDQCHRQIIEESKIKCIQSGWCHNGILTEGGNLFLWGRNSYGQLATANAITSKSLLLLSGFENQIKEFHLGSEHGIIVNEIGDAFAWGWNEHGNCGNGNEINV